MKQITYVYDHNVEIYYRIVKENETSSIGIEDTIDKPENPDLKTLTIAPVGTQVYNPEQNVYGVIDKLDINDCEQPYRIRWYTQYDLEPWPEIEQIVMIND